MLRRKKATTDGSDGAYTELRKQALDAAFTQTAKPQHPDVLGVVVDVPLGPDHLTVMTLADGTTSMYTSSGGGTIGGGAHPSVVAASEALLTQVQADLVLFPSDSRTNLPPEDLVQITVLTPKGRHRASIPEPAFWGKEPTAVGDLIAAMQNLISAIREAKAPSTSD